MAIDFVGQGKPLGSQEFADAVTALGVDAASLWALVAVETRGFGFFSDRRPLMLFERHVFHRRTGGIYSAAHPDISNAKPGGYAKGEAEYDRLDRAMGLDEQAALESTSWGLGQIMGYHAAELGFADVYAMVGAIVNDEGAHVRAIVGFFKSNPPLQRALQTHDWAKVAFYYNGKNYQSNRYDEKLEQNHAIFSAAGSAPDMSLRTAQACLLYLGYLDRGVDGIWGPATAAALAGFRKARGIAIPPAPGLDPPTATQLAAAANV